MRLPPFLRAAAAKKRREEFRAYAASKGWTYVERDDRWVGSFTGAPFGQGHNQQANNVVTGSHDNQRSPSVGIARTIVSQLSQDRLPLTIKTP